MVTISSEQGMALRRARMAAAPAFLRGAFRPFFFAGSLWAVLALVLWLCALAGVVELPSRFDALAWHRHEMLFGFVGAIVGGFLLTAIANWTARPLISGYPLAALFALWVGARIAILFSAETGAGLAALLDVGFFVAVAALAAREVIAARNRNVPVVALVLLLGLAAAADHAASIGLADDGGLGFRSGIALVVMIISLIGGRIIPAFTRNWLIKRGRQDRLPVPANRFDLATLAATALALVAWIAAPLSAMTGALLIGAGLAQAVRLMRWRGIRAASDPMVFVLHVGYFWVPTGLLLMGAGLLGAAIPGTVAVHALTAGAMATMILAVMTRATLGHTGRELSAGSGTLFIYLLVTLGALLRVAAPFGLFDYTLGMRLAGLAWAGAFIAFLLVYGRYLLVAHHTDPTR